MAVQSAVSAPRVYSGAYKGWVLFLIFLVMMNNYIDRNVMGVVSQYLKVEFDISDFRLGLLGGSAFGLFYMFMGIPFARLAERFNRVTLMSMAMIVWSLLTALCGGAQSYWQMFALRIGVGVGEAGATPTSLSLISDYFPAGKRASAISMWSFGIAAGGIVGSIVSGYLVQHYGWRAAFMVVGLPGILLALLLKLTMTEPPRGHTDAMAHADETPSFLEVLKILFTKPTFVHMAIGGGLANFAIQGIGAFGIPYYLRRFQLPIETITFFSGTLGGIAAAAGMLLGGSFVDWISRGDKRWYAWLPAICIALACPLHLIAYTRSSFYLTVAVGATSSMILFLFHAPHSGVTMNLSPARARATAASIQTLFAALIGVVCGPPGVGLLSDYFTAHAFAQGPAAFAALCPHGVAVKGATAAAKAACLAASGRGAQEAILLTSVLFLWGGLHFALASRHIKRDLATAGAFASSDLKS